MLRVLRRIWRVSTGDRPLLFTFWPQDYPRQKSIWSGGRNYVVTGYARAAGAPNWFVVYGKKLPRSRQQVLRVSTRHQRRGLRPI